MTERIKYKSESNPALRIALGVSIAKGRMRKEVSREFMIYLKVYESRTIQLLYNPLADWIIIDSKEYKGKAILKQLAGWWIWEGLDRCSQIASYFTEFEQILIYESLLNKRLQIK